MQKNSRKCISCLHLNLDFLEIIILFTIKFKVLIIINIYFIMFIVQIFNIMTDLIECIFKLGRVQFAIMTVMMMMNLVSSEFDDMCVWVCVMWLKLKTMNGHLIWRDAWNSLLAMNGNVYCLSAFIAFFLSARLLVTVISCVTLWVIQQTLHMNHLEYCLLVYLSSCLSVCFSFLIIIFKKHDTQKNDTHFGEIK